MASNEDSLRDGNGRASDWVEIHNPNQTPANLAGWHLTDVPANRTKWTFPSATIEPGGYLTLFASGDNVPDPSGNLHTNFQLDADGDYLALVKPDGMTVVSEYNTAGVNFPNQDEDISYGRGQQATTTSLVDVGASAKILIPTTANGGDTLGTSWHGGSEPFNDASWTSGATGIGYGDFTPPIQIAGELFVDLDANDASAGMVTWTNTGTLGNFARVGGPTVVTLDGRRGVQFNSTATLDAYQSPVNAPAGLVGLNPTRTIEAWVYNPAIATEETIVAWGRRGGPAGTNMSFNYGTNVNFGAIGHWDAPDIGWGAVPPAGQWNHVVYTYDGTTTRVYANGVQTNSEELGAGVINTYSGTKITLAAQIDNAAGALNTALRGTLTIGKMRIHDGVLTAEQIANNYQLERPLFPLPAPPTPQTLSAPPVHRYSFNDGTANDSIGTLNGTLFNGASVSGGALTLNSAAQQYVNLPGNDIAALGAATGAVTVEAWGTYSAANGDWTRILDFGASSGANGANYIFLSPRSGAGTTRAAISNADPGFNSENFADGAVSTTGVAVHIVAVFDDTNNILNLFINGNPAGGTTMTIPLSAVQNTLGYIGRSLYSADAYLTGSIDEFRIYNYALTRNQALGNFQAGPNTVNLGPSPPAPALEAPPISTQIQSAMQNVNSSAFVRIPFIVSDPTAISSLVLRARYDDGFVAYINGVEVARRNAPAMVAWNSTATAARAVGDVIVPEEINLSASLTALRAGTNMLAIQGLNISAADGDFLVLPELVATTITTNTSENRFFTVPTPGEPNNAGVIDFVKDTHFDVLRGFYDAPFDVTISTITPGATIVYTTDASDPSLTNGTAVPATGPDVPGRAVVHITHSTPLRAKAFKADWDPTDIDTQTYIFLDNVVSQSLATATANGFPSTWGPIAVDYDVDPRVTGNPAYSAEFKNDLKTIPSVSIVMDNDDVFGAANGVYANAAQRGDQWERPTSIEWIDPNNPMASYQENAGVRAFGGVGRTNSARSKYSLRVIFREQYGAAKGHFPVFPDTDVVDHNSLVLKMNWNYSWTGDSTAAGGLGTQAADYLRDVFGRDTARDMGLPVAKGRPVNLYINGLYWGLYHAIERTDEQWAAETFGGTEDDFDILKPVAEVFSNIPMEVMAGDRTAWDQLMAAAAPAVNLALPANYQAIQQRVDIDQLIDYMLMVFYTGSRDAPTLLGNLVEPRNFWAVRNKGPGGDGKWRFLAWDVEWALEQPAVNRVNPGYSGGHDNPAFLFDRLKTNPDFVVRVMDRVQKHFFNGGALTREAGQARYMARANEIFGAIVGESARWGDKLRPAQPYTRNIEWVAERDRIVNLFLGPRTDTVLTQLRSAGLFPAVNAPNLLVNGQPQYGGTVTAGAQLTLTDPNAPTGTIYYTLDGTDPRNPPSQLMSSVILSETASARVLVPKVANGGDLLGDTWKGAAANEPFDDSAWMNSPTGARIGFDTNGTGSNFNTNPGFDLDIGTALTTAPVNTSFFVRVPFTIADQATLDNMASLVFRHKFDDGFVGYINGQEIARGGYSTPGAPPWNATATSPRFDSSAVLFQDFPVSGSVGSLLRVGTNILAIHGLNRASTTSDSLDALSVPQLVAVLKDVSPTARLYTGPIGLLASTVVNARILRGSTWSAASQSLYTVETPIRVTELNYHPNTRTDAEIAAGFMNDDDFEFAEIANISPTDPVNLAGVRFIDGIQFTFGNETLAPGEHAVVVHDLAAFQFRYGTGIRVLGQYGGTPENYLLANGGETLTLVDAAGGMIQSFRYDDDWFPETDGRGPTLVIVDPNADRSNWDLATGWRSSFENLGSPGMSDTMSGDFNLDNRVGTADLAVLQTNLGTASGATRTTGDLTGDGAVSRSDVAAFIVNLGRFYPPLPPPPSPAAPAAVVATSHVFRVFGAGPTMFGAGPTMFGAGLPTAPVRGGVRRPAPNALRPAPNATEPNGPAASRTRLTAQRRATAVDRIFSESDANRTQTRGTLRVHPVRRREFV